VAQDLAIDDTLYFLGKALDRERIDSTTYLKVGDHLCSKEKSSPNFLFFFSFLQVVRTLARDQFFKRALIARIREELHIVNS